MTESIHATPPEAMPSAFAPIEQVRPPRVLFGGGLVASVGAWARENGIARTLVVADAFNAARVGLLDLPGAVTVFDRVQPKRPPIGRFVKPEEVAALTAFLLSDSAASITGQRIVVCGGASLV
ncbi:SDR family oxidoreductase [Azospirillum sp. Marseille-Q6669]